jgi:glycerophosphoryl diester phosphodiesterase
LIDPLIIAHRGASAVAAENTMAAFREAIAAGADGIEFDVRLSKDHVPVIIHDNTLRRTGRSKGRIADLTWNELKQVDVGSWFTGSSEILPSLIDLFTLFESNDLLLYLEMKCDSPSDYVPLAEACSKLIRSYNFQERVIVECFDLRALEIVKKIAPDIKTAALFESAIPLPFLLDQRIIDQTVAVGASELALHHRLARPRLVQKAKLAGLQVVVWTVDNPKWIERASSIGIDALITNDPAAMLALDDSSRASAQPIFRLT